MTLEKVTPTKHGKPEAFYAKPVPAGNTMLGGTLGTVRPGWQLRQERSLHAERERAQRALSPGYREGASSGQKRLEKLTAGAASHLHFGPFQAYLEPVMAQSGW